MNAAYTSYLAPDFKDLFASLAEGGQQILLYGMGNGADKIMEKLEAMGLFVADIFASDGFVRGQVFHGRRVLSYREICEKYDPAHAVVLLAFGSTRPEVLEAILAVADRFPVLVPDLPVCGGDFFDRAFFLAHQGEIEAARALFSDEASRTLYDRIIAARLEGTLSNMLAAVSERDPWDYLAAAGISIRRAADFGAYNGDSARDLLSRHAAEWVLCAEPDRRNFRKLTDWSAGLDKAVVECHRVAVCDKVGEAAFDASGNRNAGLCTGRAGDTVPTDTPDRLLAGRAVDYIKYDIEGAEYGALLGSAKTIAAHRPALRISLYHHSEDLFTLPLLLSRLAPHYRFYLTRCRGVPAWDIDLVAVPEK